MAYIKTQEEIASIIEGGKLLGEVLEELVSMVKPGVNTLAIDKKAEALIRGKGGIPAFKGYQPHKSDPAFPATICASINDEVVHGIPKKDRTLKEGDLFTIDIGMQYPANSGRGQQGNGFFTDTAITIPVGKVDTKAKKLMEATQKALEIGIAQCVIGNAIADIGRAIEAFITPQGYGIVRDLVGHGVGHGVHEDPMVPNYYAESLEEWKIEPGVVIAIEPMITLGLHDVMVGKDHWTILTKDRKLSAHSEHTIVITDHGPVVATRRPSEK